MLWDLVRRPSKKRGNPGKKQQFVASTKLYIFRWFGSFGWEPKRILYRIFGWTELHGTIVKRGFSFEEGYALPWPNEPLSHKITSFLKEDDDHESSLYKPENMVAHCLKSAEKVSSLRIKRFRSPKEWDILSGFLKHCEPPTFQNEKLIPFTWHSIGTFSQRAYKKLGFCKG